uniref:Profilin n=1 Tax=Haptolina brevifila TaxID=156173 RepID=A0A7S2CE49_9EUKA|mmetsp:Transcript_23578/g.47104  ORF Transcript_23578/g.47104 Transcript_23578/m.47104 type:complete len:140 (+) Transcript_23578:65-484(+)|eukprot:CAMPEP_0174738052 /NCGR_PEP_ID=MMETSP1094-20130205/69283_1 /TAXON_ID=156173 /ORGANISM="Chrysochromulina brevifilum, Strain UTEX LB 985" /LENGTH=139 /DNA_ID=CAMNT_0015941387 /DNA_START=59 /DNA_END=478 /DNA_ORIENTATION=-
MSGVWERSVGVLTSRVVSGGAILPIQPDGPASTRKNIIYAQKGVSMRVPEASALIEAIMDGRVHRDYVTVGGQQYLLTTVMESAYYGRSTSSSAGGGIVLVKTQRVLVLATYTDPVMAAEAIPYVHEFTDSVMGTLGGM